MKWLPSINVAKEEGLNDNSSRDTSVQLYTKNRQGQFELYPPPTIFQRVVSFFKSLKYSDFD